MATNPYTPYGSGVLSPTDSSGSAGLDILKAAGINVSGGSTVSSSGGVTSPSVSGTPNAQVYMGKRKAGTKTYDPDRGGFSRESTSKKSSPIYLSYKEAQLLPTTWSDKQLKEFTNKLTMYGYGSFAQEGAKWGLPEVMDAWDELLKASMNFSVGDKKFTPWDVLETYNKKPGSMGTITRDGWVFDAATGDRLSYKGPRSKTSTQRDVNLSSGEQVQALSRQVLQELLGRAPTDDEFAQYKDSLNNYESSNPLVTTTTATISDEQIQQAIKNNTDIDWSTAATSSTSSGGVDDSARAELIGSSVREKPEYAKYQAGTTYWNAMLSVLGGPFG